MQNTARSALLQMVNTVLKRVGQQVLTPHGTPLASPATSLRAAFCASSMPGSSTGSAGHLPSAAEADMAATTTAAEQQQQASGDERDRLATKGSSAPSLDASLSCSVTQQQQEVVALASQQQREPHDLAAQQQELRQLEQQEVEGSAGEAGGDGSLASPKEAIADAVEQAMSAMPGDLPPLPLGQPEEPNGELPLLPPIATGVLGTLVSAGSADAEVANLAVSSAMDDDARTAQLASMAEQADLRGLERALDSLPSAPDAPGGDGPRAGDAARLARQDTPPDPRRAIMRNRRARAWKLLTVCERDAVVVLSAMCKARRAGLGVL